MSKDNFEFINVLVAAVKPISQRKIKNSYNVIYFTSLFKRPGRRLYGPGFLFFPRDQIYTDFQILISIATTAPTRKTINMTRTTGLSVMKDKREVIDVMNHVNTSVAWERIPDIVLVEVVPTITGSKV